MVLSDNGVNRFCSIAFGFWMIEYQLVIYRVTSINNASSISTAVQYYLSTNNIEPCPQITQDLTALKAKTAKHSTKLYRSNKLLSKLQCTQLATHMILTHMSLYQLNNDMDLVTSS